MASRNAAAPLLLIGFAAFLLIRDGGGDAAPVPPLGAELSAVFDGHADGKAHARTLAEICHAVADVVEYDGTLTTPRLKNGVQLDDLRAAVRDGRTRGWSFIATYPALKPIFETHFTNAVGTSGGPLDATRRAAWVTAFRQLAAASEHAAGRRWPWQCQAASQKSATSAALAFAALAPL